MFDKIPQDQKNRLIVGIPLFILFTVIIVLFLLIFQMLLISLGQNGTFSFEYFSTYLSLNSSNPTLSGMYLSSYTHNPIHPSHLIENVVVFVFVSLVIAIIWYARALTIPIPKYYFLLLIPIVYVVGPIVISFSTLLSANLFGYSVICNGFSGIIAALIGVGIVLLIPLTSEFSKNKLKIAKYIPHISIICIIWEFVYDFINMSGTDMTSNLPGHVGGLFFGIAIAYLLTWYLSEKNPENR